ncbi:aminotransferase class V-fold PLP-dependent enzyme [Dokdonella immobilis]|uniref:Selenocysteine lyase/Cysteine desulfurase n=1 Tax=Dokdonella immobilis TaxID=578942 RepID=A0A1I4YRW0_9GAMM|nr:aminotransferase class V-fold PLP-dependent enzyme [Dokdonella immobilis]SFN40746.1 Selenocysteine lyase/Cysteine desulfurase [Dokdonella immobilis]
MKAPLAFDGYFDELRRREFARLDAHGCAYLDYTGSALYGASQVEAQARLLADGMFGNPHSEHRPSRHSAELIETARRAVLAWFNVDADSHAVCFVANASAAIKLVAESYPFSSQRGLMLSADNHNSVNGIREFARRAGAAVGTIPLDSQLRLRDPLAHLSAASASGPGLFAFPAQSNFSGVRHPLDLIASAHDRGWDVLLDAAAFVPSGRLDLRHCRADFTAVSFYKMFGLPTGVGALVARRDALARLRRPWFAGGTVDHASVQLDRHRLTEGAQGHEDGTPNFLDIGMIAVGLDFIAAIGNERLSRRLQDLTAHFLRGLVALQHPSGAPLVCEYGPDDNAERGATVAFNVLDPQGRTLPFLEVEQRASAAGVALRGGCFCNPGCAETAFGFQATAVARCLDRLGDAFSLPRFASCLGSGIAVGALRASFGAPTSLRDIDRALSVIASFAEIAARRRIASRRA